MHRLFNRSRLWLLTVATAGGLFVLQGCDPTVRDTVLTGVGTAATSLTSTFIQAFIQSLQAQDEQTATTVRAVLDYLPQFA
jgi:hypothetical protein